MDEELVHTVFRTTASTANLILNLPALRDIDQRIGPDEAARRVGYAVTEAVRRAGMLPPPTDMTGQ
jgi:hypothetical protein